MYDLLTNALIEIARGNDPDFEPAVDYENDIYPYDVWGDHADDTYEGGVYDGISMGMNKAAKIAINALRDAGWTDGELATAGIMVTRS